MTAVALDLSAARDVRGRFQPGVSGNPAGKKLGTLHKKTQMERWLAEGDADTIGTKIVAKAKAGEWGPARFVLERLDPKPRHRPIELNFPDGATRLECMEETRRWMSAGGISPAEANDIARFLKSEGEIRRESEAQAAWHAELLATVDLLQAQLKEALAAADKAKADAEAARALHSACISQSSLSPVRSMGEGREGARAAPQAPAPDAESLHSPCISTSTPASDEPVAPSQPSPIADATEAGEERARRDAVVPRPLNRKARRAQAARLRHAMPRAATAPRLHSACIAAL